MHHVIPPSESSTQPMLLLRLLSDIYMCMYEAFDRNEQTLLAPFNVSAACDTVDYNILLKLLNIMLGLSGSFLDRLLPPWAYIQLGRLNGSTYSRCVPAPDGLPHDFSPFLPPNHTSSIGLPLA